jgi:hypothetical protein
MERIDLDKYRSIGTLPPGSKSSTRKYTVEGDRSGSYQVEHWDGRLDAHIKAKPIVGKMRREE